MGRVILAQIMILVGIGIVLYLGGYTNAFSYMHEESTDLTPSGEPSGFLNTFVAVLFTTETLGMLGVAGITTTIVALVVGGKSTVPYVIGLIFLSVAFSMFILPLSFIYESTAMNATVKNIIIVVLNGLTISTIMEFVRG